MTEFRDWRGTLIHVGSRVVYPVRHSTRVWMVEGDVLEIRPHGPDEYRMKLAKQRPEWAAMYYQPWKRFNLVVRRANSSRGDPIRLPGRKVHLTMTLSVTVIAFPGSKKTGGQVVGSRRREVPGQGC